MRRVIKTEGMKRLIKESRTEDNSMLGHLSKRFIVQGKSCIRNFSATQWHGTTIVCVRKDGKVAMAGDGQVSAGSTVVKGNARKVRRLTDSILVGFAGSTADALTLLERLEKKLEEYPGQVTGFLFHQ